MADLCKTDLQRIIKYLDDAAALYDKQHGLRNSCRAWCIRQLTQKLKKKISQNLTGRYAIIKIFPFIHALKVEVSEKFIDEQKNELTECRWRLATDKDVLDLRIPMTGENNIAKTL